MSFRDDLQRLLKDIELISGKRLFAIHTAGRRPIITHDFFVAFENMSSASPLHAMVLEEFKKCEKIAPGSSRVAARVLADMILLMLERSAANEQWKSIETFINESALKKVESIQAKNEHPAWNDLLEIVMRDIPKDIKEIVSKSLELAGPSGKIFVEKSHGDFDVIERIIGNSFHVEPLIQIMTDGMWKRDFVKCIVIDGIIESVAEIDRILTRAYETKQSTAIFARGFSNEVITTLVVNRARGALDVMAVTVPFDLESVNVLVDIATVTGNDVVSSLKGDLISSILFDEMPVVQNIQCSNGIVTIRNDSTAMNVQRHARNLALKIQETNVADISKLTENRIRSLTSDYVRILVAGRNAVERIARIEQIDQSLRLIRAIKTGGIYHDGNTAMSSLVTCSGLLSGHRLAAHLLSMLQQAA